MLNWIALNGTFLTCKLGTYAKLNCLKWNCFWHWNCTYAKLNCLIWNCLTELNSLKCIILTFDRAVNQETGASCRRYRNITLTCGRVEFGTDATPTRSRWESNNNITRCHKRLGQLDFEAGRVQFEFQSQFEFQPQLGTKCRSESQRQTEGLDPQDPGWAAQQNEEEMLLKYRGTWGQYVAVCPRLQLTSHT